MNCPPNLALLFERNGKTNEAISYWQGVYQRQLDKLHKENLQLRLQQSSKLDEISRVIVELGTRVAKSEQCNSPFTPDDIASLQTQMSRFSLSQKDAAKEHSILKSLSFDSRAARDGSIQEAHKRTFSWVFTDMQPRDHHALSSSGNFIQWLKNGDGFFWVSGKPGSGKSTLMKYATNHPTTHALLSSWAYPKPAVVACHYFWSAGTSMQKSHQGLLQTLLYDIFRQLPDLIEYACVERWAKSLEELSHESWELPELRRVLKRIADRKDLAAKFCFFIDGLDEYEGDHLDFCRALQELSNSPHVKLCVSSRPWNVFEDSFGRDEACKLYVHDLTRSDIRSYAESRLQEHPRWEEVNVEVEDAQWLVKEITERADGVFLWVFLVTRELRNGLTEWDSFSDMRRRLDSIPRDLEDFFKQILDSVEPFHHEKMATTLQISLAAMQPAPVIIYCFHDEEYEDQDYALKIPLEPLDGRGAASRKKQMSCRLNGRCRGLLEINRRSGCIEFLHRTVMDYLRTQDISTYLERKASAWFSPHFSLLKAFTAYIKSTKFSEFVDRKEFATYTTSKLMSALKEALAHAKHLEQTAIVFELLEELERCIPAMHGNGQARLNVWGNPFNPVCLFFREPAVEAGLGDYLRHILPKIPDYFADFEESAMKLVGSSVLALHRAQRLRRGESENSQSLSQQGPDANKSPCDAVKFQAETQDAWVALLERALPSNPTPDSDISQLKWLLQSGSLPMMLRQGADPNAKIYHQSSSGYTTAWMRFTATSFCIAPTSSYRDFFLRDLNAFFAAGANMRATVSYPLLDDGESSQLSGLDAFFNHFSQKTNDLNRLNISLLAEVAERLMFRARDMGMETDCYWHIIEKMFRPQVVSRVRKSFAAGNRVEKRLWDNVEIGERTYKRRKSTIN